MTSDYVKHKEKKLKAVKVEVTPEEIAQLQLYKIYELIQAMQKQKIRALMSKMAMFQAKPKLMPDTSSESLQSGAMPVSANTGLLSNLFGDGARQTRIDITKKQVSLFYLMWGEAL